MSLSNLTGRIGLHEDVYRKTLLTNYKQSLNLCD